MKHTLFLHVATLASAALIAVGSSVGYSQEMERSRGDSAAREVRLRNDDEQILLGEDPVAIEAESWERQSIPVSLAEMENRGIPASPDQVTGNPRARTSARVLYFESSVSRTNGLMTMPADTLLLGTPFSSLFRLRIHPARCWDAHFVLAKQAGEQFADAAMRGSICYSAEEGVRVILGDYVVNVSHGLALSGNRASIGEGVTRSSSSREQLSPYFGAGTMGFLRGAAIRLMKRMEGGTGNIVIFASRRALAATTREDGTVRSIDWTGYERTEKESQKQSRLHETFFGARCSFGSTSGMSAGVTWSRTLYDRMIVPESGIGFTGDRSEVAGMDLGMNMRHARLSAELARLPDGSLSFVSRAEVRPAVGTTVVVAARSYGVGFSNPHASAFGHHRDGGNEQGIFLAFSTRPVPDLEVDGSVDAFRYPGRSSSTMFPASGTEAGLQTVVGRSTATTVTVRLRLRHSIEERIVTAAPSGEFRRDVMVELLSVGGLVRIPLGPDFQLKCRFSTVSHRPDCGLRSSRGSLLGAGASWRLREAEIEGAMSLFTTESYDAAVSVIEPGAARTISAMTCYGSGARVSVSASWRPWDMLLISLKVGSTMSGWKPSSESGIPDMHPPSLTTFTMELSSLF